MSAATGAGRLQEIEAYMRSQIIFMFFAFTKLAMKGFYQVQSGLMQQIKSAK
jgi:hypothetical protein